MGEDVLSVLEDAIKVLSHREDVTDSRYGIFEIHIRFYSAWPPI
jgi:hypothetical protein